MALTDLIPALPSNFIYTLILPFIILFTIFWAVLTAMKIFGNKVNTVLSLGLTLMIFYSGGFAIFTNFIFQSTTTLAVVVFGIVFIFGIITWAFSRSRDIYNEAAGYGRKIDRLQKDIAKLKGKYETASDKQKPMLTRQITELEKQLEDVKAQQKMAMEN